MESFATLEGKIQLVKDDLLSRLPGVPHTITILLWDDHTSRVECRHGDGFNIHTSTYYNGNLEYKVEPMLSGSMMTTSDGHRYFLKDKDAEKDLSDALPSPDFELKKENPSEMIECADARALDLPTISTPQTVKLIEFDVLNRNERIYEKKVIEPLLGELNRLPYYGEASQGSYTINKEEICCKLFNFRIEGRFLKGDMQIVDTEKGRNILKNLDKYVFRSRAVGDIKGQYVIDLQILTFDAVHIDDDGFHPMIETELEIAMNSIKTEIK